MSASVSVFVSCRWRLRSPFTNPLAALLEALMYEATCQATRTAYFFLTHSPFCNMLYLAGPSRSRIRRLQIACHSHSDCYHCKCKGHRRIGHDIQGQEGGLQDRGAPQLWKGLGLFRRVELRLRRQRKVGSVYFAPHHLADQPANRRTYREPDCDTHPGTNRGPSPGYGTDNRHNCRG